MTHKRPIHVMLYHVQPLISIVIQALLNRQEGISVLPEIPHHPYRPGIDELAPHVVLISGGGGGSAPLLDPFYTSFLYTFPNAKLILLVDQEMECCAEELLAAPIAGCLLKEDLNPALIHLIRAVAAGETVYSRAVVAKLIDAAKSTFADFAAFGLTEREGDVLELMARGYTNGEIAATLCLSPQTVRNKATQIYDKIGVGSRVELLAWARQQGLG